MDTFVTGTLPQKKQIEVDVNKEKSGRKKTRKYDSSYLNFGFTVAEKGGRWASAMCYLLQSFSCGMYAT